MWGAISTFVIIFFGLLWYLFSVGTNSHVRAKAQEHPESWIHLYVTLFDQVLKATIFRSAQHRPIANEGSSSVDSSLRENANTMETVAPKQAFIAEYAMQALIDPKPKVPKHIWALVRLETVMVGACVLVIAVSISMKILAMQFFSIEVAMTVFSVTLVGLFTFVFLSIAMEWGPFNISMKLHMNPFLLVIATKGTVFLHSSWLPRTLMSNQRLRFSAFDGPFMSNLLVVRDDQPPAIVFTYPSFFGPYLSLDGGLSALAERLNRVIEIARYAPELDLDKPVFQA